MKKKPGQKLITFKEEDASEQEGCKSVAEREDRD